MKIHYFRNEYFYASKDIDPFGLITKILENAYKIVFSYSTSKDALKKKIIIFQTDFLIDYYRF